MWRLWTLSPKDRRRSNIWPYGEGLERLFVHDTADELSIHNRTWAVCPSGRLHRWPQTKRAKTELASSRTLMDWSDAKRAFSSSEYSCRMYCWRMGSRAQKPTPEASMKMWRSTARVWSNWRNGTPWSRDGSVRIIRNHWRSSISEDVKDRLRLTGPMRRRNMERRW